MTILCHPWNVIKVSWVSNARGSLQLLHGGPWRGVSPCWPDRGRGYCVSLPYSQAFVPWGVSLCQRPFGCLAVFLHCVNLGPIEGMLHARRCWGEISNSVLFSTKCYNFSFGEVKTVWGRKEYKEERIICNLMTVKKSCYVLSSSALDRFSWQNYSNCIWYIQFCIRVFFFSWTFSQWHINTLEAFFKCLQNSLIFRFSHIYHYYIVEHCFVVYMWVRYTTLILLIWGMIDQRVWDLSCRFPEDWAQNHFHHVLLVRQLRNLDFKREENEPHFFLGRMSENLGALF